MQSQGYRAPLPAPPLAVVSIRGEEARAGSATLSFPKSPDKDRQDPQGPKGVILSLSLSPSESSLSFRKGRRKPAQFENQPKPWAPPTGIHDSWSRGIEPQPCLRVGRRQLVHHFLSTHLLPEASGGQLVMCRIAKKHQTRSRSPCAWPRRACTRKLWSWGVPKAARLPSPCPTPGRVRKHAGNRARERRQARKN